MAGLFVAIDDATTENGCLEFIPGSHKGSLNINNNKIFIEFIGNFLP